MPRLRRADCSGPGIHRLMRGSGFSYIDDDGERVDEREVLERIRELGIPPAWNDVWICTAANGHIQVTARDASTDTRCARYSADPCRSVFRWSAGILTALAASAELAAQSNVVLKIRRRKFGRRRPIGGVEHRRRRARKWRTQQCYFGEDIGSDERGP